MKVYSRDMLAQEFINENGKIMVRNICAPCKYHQCVQLEVDDRHASRCKVSFIDEEGNNLGLCECISTHDSHVKLPAG